MFGWEFKKTWTFRSKWTCHRIWESFVMVWKCDSSERGFKTNVKDCLSHFGETNLEFVSKCECWSFGEKSPFEKCAIVIRNFGNLREEFGDFVLSHFGEFRISQIYENSLDISCLWTRTVLETHEMKVKIIGWYIICFDTFRWAVSKRKWKHLDCFWNESVDQFWKFILWDKCASDHFQEFLKFTRGFEDNVLTLRFETWTFRSKWKCQRMSDMLESLEMWDMTHFGERFQNESETF